ncbi:MAG: hypothetical protein Q4E73_04955 [Lachnospiraceae bacterium]|nr:hypothetical protein [Lachnospiraceae bacterium]
MKFRKYLMILCVAVTASVVLTGCGGQKDQNEGGTQAEADSNTEKEEVKEEVTEFKKDQQTLSFSDIENGINFKAAGTSVVFEFEDIDSFDNSLKMEFSLTDAAYEKDPVVMSISDKKAKYQFDNLEKGKEYYLEVYPTESANSDSEYEKIQEKNADCQLKLIQ